jgi:hypothetical protein
VTAKEPGKKEEEKTIVSKNGDYEIAYKLTTTANLAVTVPLYVCLYAYGADGTVATPSSDAYQLKNYSTQSGEATEIVIYPRYQLTKIGDSEKEAIEKDTSATVDNTHNTGGNGYNAGGDYYYYYTENDTTYHIVFREDVETVGSDYFYVDKKNALSDGTTEVEVVAGQKITSSTKKIDSSFDEDLQKAFGLPSSSYLETRVASVKAESKTWILVADGQATKAKDLSMKINSLDLSTATGENGASVYGWSLGVAKDADNPGTLSLPIEAAIAGDGLNEETADDTAAITVTYTITAASDTTTANQ